MTDADSPELPTELTAEQLAVLEAGETLYFTVDEREALLPALSAIDGLEAYPTGHSYVIGNPDADWDQGK